MAKEQKVETRDILYEKLAGSIMEKEGVDKVSRYKEGLRVDIDGEPHIVRVVKKKAEPADDELNGSYLVEDGKLVYRSKKVKKEKD